MVDFYEILVGLHFYEILGRGDSLLQPTPPSPLVPGGLGGAQGAPR